MIINTLEEIMNQKEISINKLSLTTGIRYATLFNFIKNKTQKADYSMMNKICKELSCTPGDFLKYIPDN